MSQIKILDKEFALYIQAAEIQKAVNRIAQEMNRDLVGKNPLFLVVLNGSFMFAADLLKQITIPCEVSFIKLSSYSGTQSTSEVKQIIGLTESLENRNIVIIEDIIDTGITMEHILEQLKSHSVESVKMATCLYKPAAFIKQFSIDYVGIEIPNDFIIGYGLDYNGYARNYPDIYRII